MEETQAKVRKVRIGNGKGIKATLKQKNWTVEYLKSGNKTAAALKAYPGVTRGSASQIGFSNSNSPAVKTYMAEILSVAGLTEEKIAGGINTIVDAGLTRRSLKKTTTQDTLRALELASRLKDLFPAEKKDIRQASISLKYEKATDKELLDMLKAQNEEIKTFSKLIEQSERDKLRREEIGDEAYYDELRQGSGS